MPISSLDSTDRLGVLARPASALAEGREALGEVESLALLDAYGVRTPVRQFLAIGDDLGALEPAPPWALKVVSPELLHKSDAGGVHLGLSDVDELRDAMAHTAGLPGLQGWLLEEMAQPGLELFIGGVRHPRFGPMVVVGFGGVLVEYLQDLALRICPIDAGDAHAMLNSLRASALLDGARGAAPVNRAALVDAMCRIGGADGLLMQHAGEVAELDVNPIIANADGVMAVDARIILAAHTPEAQRAPATNLQRLLMPNAVAVAGASTNGNAYGNQYIRHLRAYGFTGPIYPVHPKAAEVDGLPAYPTLGDLPEAVDYAFVAVAADRCANLLENANGKVAFAQVMAGGFGEGGEDESREAELLAAARIGQVRVLGPNCMGTHSPLGRLTYVAAPDPTPGSITVVAQSGGLSMDAIRRGRQRGIRFRSVVSVGNCADLGPAELLQWFIDDPDTRAIGLYLEDARRGRQLFELLRAARGQKPVALLVGGRTEQGARAAQSHTGAMAGDARAWEALAQQTALALTDSLDEFLDVLLAMQVAQPRPSAVARKVVLFGNGGGASVLAADAFARAGLELAPLPESAQTELRGLNLPDGASVTNPVDIPANVLQREQGAIARQIVEIIFDKAEPDIFVMHVNVPVILGYTHVDILGELIAASLVVRSARGGQSHVVLVLRSDGEPEVEARKSALRERALDAGIPVYDELDIAARAIGGLVRYEMGAAALRG